MEPVRPLPAEEDAALRELELAHRAFLTAFVLRLNGGDRGRAEDVVQETLLQAWRHRVAVAGSAQLRPWLTTVARRLVIDQHRARQARPPETGEEALADLAGDDGIEEALDRWMVTEALATLSAEHREALLHTFYAGRTVREAAAVLGIPAGTVKSRVFYALRALKGALQERGVAP